jgi:hypothetical protein
MGSSEHAWWSGRGYIRIWRVVSSRLTGVRGFNVEIRVR